MTQATTTYKSAGVDIEAGERAVDLMKASVAKTQGPNVLTGIGGFGGAFKIPGTNDLVMVTSTDGVGTRLKVGSLAGRHGTSGAALVNHCVNDLLAMGCRARTFLDYFATAKLDPEVAAQVVQGAAEACYAQGVALIGGETAEMRGIYAEGMYDFVGTITGFAPQPQIITGNQIRVGDIVIGLASDGLHTNGFTLANHIVFEQQGMTVDSLFPWSITVADELLRPHRCYAGALLPLIEEYDPSIINGAAHITGGGIPGNLIRILPEGCRAVIDQLAVPEQPIFGWLQQTGNVPLDDMRRTFNLGTGFMLVVSPEDVAPLLEVLGRAGETAYVLGEIIEGERGVEYAD